MRCSTLGRRRFHVGSLPAAMITMSRAMTLLFVRNVETTDYRRWLLLTCPAHGVQRAAFGYNQAPELAFWWLDGYATSTRCSRARGARNASRSGSPGTAAASCPTPPRCSHACTARCWRPRPTGPAAGGSEWRQPRRDGRRSGAARRGRRLGHHAHAGADPACRAALRTQQRRVPPRLSRQGSGAPPGTRRSSVPSSAPSSRSTTERSTKASVRWCARRGGVARFDAEAWNAERQRQQEALQLLRRLARQPAGRA